MQWLFYVAAWLLFFIGLAGACWSAAKALEAARLRKRGVLTHGVVVRIETEEFTIRHDEAPAIRHRFYEVVRYASPEGDELEARLFPKYESDAGDGTANPPVRPVGEAVELLASPADPRRVIEAKGSREFSSRIAGAVFSLVFAAAAAFLIARTGLRLADASPSSGRAAATVGAAAALTVCAALWLARRKILFALPAADEREIVMSGGLALALPELKPFTGRVRCRVGEATALKFYKNGRLVREVRK